MGIWYRSTVIEKRTKRTEGCRKIQQLKVGFRYYHEEGMKQDDTNFYDGWSQMYDEWISSTSPRIREREKMVKTYETIVNDKEEDIYIDD